MADQEFTTKELEPEEWRPVVSYEEHYEVSSYGRVRSLTSGKMLTQRPCGYRKAYRSVYLGRKNHTCTTSVHSLVITAFIGPRPEEMETRHLDGNASNNALSNLKYGTKSENAQDCLRHGHHNNVNKTHCPQGHPYDTANTDIHLRKTGHSFRVCLTCKRKSARDWQRQHKQAATS